MRELHCDLLIIGAGLAGTTAALQAQEQGLSVIMAFAGEGSSPRAQGGMAAAVGKKDSPSLHALDTIDAGGELCDPEAVNILTAEGVSTVAWLEGHGVRFDIGPDGERALGLEAAHGQPRILHSEGDGTGHAIMQALEIGLKDFVRLPKTILNHLILRQGRVVGASMIDSEGEIAVLANTTLLATGGYAGLYERTTNSRISNGYAMVAAMQIGAECADLEFVQFHPTVYAGTGQAFLVTEALRGAGAKILDTDGQRFLFQVDPRGELAPRSTVSRAIFEHIHKRHDPYALLDARDIKPSVLQEEFHGFWTRCQRVGLNPSTQLVPVAPAAHYTMGGILTDLWGRTRVPGLLAAGECARTGVHGANRLASNSLLEAAVFGRRSVRSLESNRPMLRFDLGPSQSPGQADYDPIVAKALADGAGLVRSQKDIDTALISLDSSSKIPSQVISRAILLSARTRQETRGAHIRSDYPLNSSFWRDRQVVFRLTPRGDLEMSIDPRFVLIPVG